MRWIKLLLISLAVLVIIIGGGVVFLLTIDLNDYRDNIERLVERQTGRSLEIDGRIDLKLGAQTSLELTNTRFSNSEWAGEPYMARVARAHVVVETWSLLDGPILIELIELDDAELHLESREDGSNNWTFGTAETDDTDDSDDSDAPDDNGIIPLVLRHVSAQKFVFTLTTPGLPQTLKIQVDQLTQQHRDDGLLDAALTGTLNERDISVTGNYGPLRNLLIAKDLQYDIHGNFDSLSIKSDGLIDDLTSPSLPRVKLVVSGPDIDDITQMLGIHDLGSGELDLKASLQPDSDGLSAQINGSIGEYVTESSGRAKALTALEDFSIQTSIHGPSLDKAMQIFGIEDVPDGPFELKGRVNRTGNQLEIDSAQLIVGSTTLNIDGRLKDFRNLEASNLQLKLSGSNVEQFRALVGIPGAATGPFQINANLNLQEDGAELLDVFMQTNIANLKISGNILGNAPEFIGTTLEFDGSGNNLADFAKLYGIPNPIAEPFTIKGAIELAGDKLVTRSPVQIGLGDDTLNLEGTLGYEPLERDTDIRVSAIGSNLAEVGAMAGVTEGIPAVGYDVRGELAVRSNGYEIRNLDAKIGTGKLTLDGLISRNADLRGTVVKFSATGPKLGEFVADTTMPGFADAPFDISGSAELQSEAVRLQQVAVKIGGATASIDADIGLPIESATGRFVVDAAGPNLRAVLLKPSRWQPPEAPFKIHAKGRLDNGLWSFDELTAQLADAQFSGNGVFDQPPDLARTRLTLNAQIPNLAAVGSIDDKQLPSTNVDVGMDFSGSPQSFSIEKFKAQIGKGDIDGNLIVHLDQAVPEIKLQFKSNLLDLTPLLQRDPQLAEDLDEAGDSEQAKDTTAKPGDGRVIPDWPLPLELLKKVNATADIDADRILFGNVEYDNFELDAKLRDGNLVVERANAKTPNGDINATLSIIQKSDTAYVKTTLDATGVILGIAAKRSKEDVALAPRYNPNIELAGSGLTLREVAATLEGTVEIIATEGKFPNAATRFLFGDFFQELLSAVNPFMQKEKYTTLSCLVILLDVTDGLIMANPGLVAQTDSMNIATNGDISLVTEKIDLAFKTAPRERVSISVGEFINPYLMVGGTLNKPYLTLDPTGVLVSGGAAVATAGLSLLATAAWDRVFRESDPCGAAIEESKKAKEKDGKKKRKKFLGVF